MKCRRIFLMLFTSMLFSVSTCGVLTSEYLKKQFGGMGKIAVAADSSINKDERYVELDWKNLIPPDWNLSKVFDDLNLDGLDDNDPRAEKAMERLKKMWDEAPTNPAVQGKAVKISGFVASLDFTGNNELKEFLLVPYFGACIHLPPPPANQIIHVTLGKPRKDIRTRDLITVYGKLVIDKTETEMGNSGYRMEATAIELYVEKK